jgi:hypothetical protein
MKKAMNIKLFILFIIIFALSSCADVTIVNECIKDEPYGFWGGLWHGFISPWSFIGSLIWDDIAMYALNNNGGWYDFGFVLGSGILFGSSRYNNKK